MLELFGELLFEQRLIEHRVHSLDHHWILVQAQFAGFLNGKLTLDQVFQNGFAAGCLELEEFQIVLIPLVEFFQRDGGTIDLGQLGGRMGRNAGDHGKGQRETKFSLDHGKRVTDSNGPWKKVL